MASKQREGDPYRAGYGQPEDPYPYRTPTVTQPSPTGRAYVYPSTDNSTNVVILTERAPPLFNWTLPAVLVCIFCASPIGICAIIYAVNARNAYYAGNYNEEKSKTAWAKVLTIWAIIFGVLVWFFNFLAFYHDFA